MFYYAKGIELNNKITKVENLPKLIKLFFSLIFLYDKTYFQHCNFFKKCFFIAK